jgi:hypothetical protein
MTQNVFYPKLKVVVDSALVAFSDGKVTVSEMWVFLLALTEAIQTVLAEAGGVSDTDLGNLKEAANMLYDEYVLPIDLIGPDWLVDPLIRNGIMPGLVEAAFRLAKSKMK